MGSRLMPQKKQLCWTDHQNVTLHPIHLTLVATGSVVGLVGAYQFLALRIVCCSTLVWVWRVNVCSLLLSPDKGTIGVGNRAQLRDHC